MFSPMDLLQAGDVLVPEKARLDADLLLGPGFFVSDPQGVVEQVVRSFDGDDDAVGHVEDDLAGAFPWRVKANRGFIPKPYNR